MASKRSVLELFGSVWVLPAHAILSVALTIGVILIDGLVVNPSATGRESDGKTWLTVSDVTTIVSAAATVTGWATSAWYSSVLWKSAFILMRTDGLSISQFDHMLSFMLPFKFRGRIALVIAMLTIAMFPATISQPLLTGAIDWTTTDVFISAGSLSAVSGGATRDAWFWYLNQPQSSRSDGWAITTTGIAAQTWANVVPYPGRRCRHLGNGMWINSYTPIPVNSTVEDAILPCIQIHDLTWDDLPWDPKVLHLLQNNASLLSLAGSNPLGPDFWGPGQVFVYDLNPWNSPQKYLHGNIAATQLPNSTVFSGTKKVLLQLTRQKTNNCTVMTDSPFGNATFLSHIKNAYPLVQNPTDENCYLSGTITITAGVVKSPQSRFVTARVIEAAADNLRITPSVWTEEVMFQLPDVMNRVSLINPSQAARTNDLENYVSDILAVSYMASWDTFYAEMDNFTNPVNLKVNQRVNMLVARVSKARAFAWLAIAMLFVLSGIILLRYEIAHSKRSLTNGPIAALMTDTSGVKPADLDALSACSQVWSAEGEAYRIEIDKEKVNKQSSQKAKRWKVRLSGGKIRETGAANTETDSCLNNTNTKGVVS